MESTAHYWLALFTRLRKDGYHVILLNPIQTSAMRDMFIRKIKTDAKDSFIIAELIRFGRYAESNVAQDRLLALKELCRNRFYLVDMAGDLKRKTDRSDRPCFSGIRGAVRYDFLQVLRGGSEKSIRRRRSFPTHIWIS